MPVTISEMQDSPQESFGLEGNRATCRYICDWEDRYTAFAQLIYSAYPHHWSTNLFCKSVDIAPYSETVIKEVTPGDPSIGYHQKAVLTCQFEPLQGATRDPEDPDNPMGMTLFEEEVSGASEMLTLDQQEFWWHRWTSESNVWHSKQFLDFEKDGPRRNTELVTGIEAPSIQIHSFDWNLTYYEVTALPATATLIGCVNDDEVTSPTLGYTFDAETLLLIPPSIRRTVTTGGSLSWTLNISFGYRPTGWNKFYWAHWDKDPWYSFWKEGAVHGGSGDIGEDEHITGPWNYIATEGNETDVFKPFEPKDFTAILPPPAS